MDNELNFVKVGSAYVNPKHITYVKLHDYDLPYSIHIELVTGKMISEEYYEKDVAISTFEELTKREYIKDTKCDGKYE